MTFGMEPAWNFLGKADKQILKFLTWSFWNTIYLAYINLYAYS